MEQQTDFTLAVILSVVILVAAVIYYSVKKETTLRLSERTFMKLIPLSMTSFVTEPDLLTAIREKTGVMPEVSDFEKMVNTLIEKGRIKRRQTNLMLPPTKVGEKKRKGDPVIVYSRCM